LGDQNRYRHNQLVNGTDLCVNETIEAIHPHKYWRKSAYRAAQVSRRNLRQVHGRQASVETAVDANENTSSDEHFVRTSHFTETHQGGGNNGEQVVEEQTSFSNWQSKKND